MREIWSFKKPYTCIFKFLGHYYFVENLKSVFFFLLFKAVAVAVARYEFIDLKHGQKPRC
jgi:hypothetical protein